METREAGESRPWQDIVRQGLAQNNAPECCQLCTEMDGLGKCLVGGCGEEEEEEAVETWKIHETPQYYKGFSPVAKKSHYVTDLSGGDSVFASEQDAQAEIDRCNRASFWLLEPGEISKPIWFAELAS